MSVKGKICLVLLLVVVLATTSFGRSERDSEVNECQQKCEQFGSGGDVEIVCKRKCEWYGPEKNDIVFAEGDRDLKKIVAVCHQVCQGSQGEQKRPDCFQTCMKEQFQKQETGKSEDIPRAQNTGKSRKQHQQDRSNNPYVFHDHHFTTRLETDQGNVRILQKFTDRSDLFRGIENYRVAFLEAEPQTFVIPNHWDADALFFVVNGQGTISLVNQESRQSHNIKSGDIFRVPAGISAYLINTHNNERLVLAKILRSISVPGELQNFFSVGGDNPESSFLDAFSPEYLEAAFDADQESLDRLFGQQHQQQQQHGIFKKATEEQIRSLTGKDEGGSTWPFSSKKQHHGPYNVFKNGPSVANENGNLHVVNSNDYSDLREMNVAFSFFNITQGSIAGPLYNARSTVVLVVPNGEGRFEMACPHLTEQATRYSAGITSGYQKVSSELRRGTVVVVPAGHPIIIEASGNQDLEIISFGLNSDVNEWFPVAGRDGVISQWEDEAIVLTFGAPANEVRQVIQKQKKRFFFSGPARSGRAFV